MAVYKHEVCRALAEEASGKYNLDSPKRGDMSEAVWEKGDPKRHTHH